MKEKNQPERKNQERSLKEIEDNIKFLKELEKRNHMTFLRYFSHVLIILGISRLSSQKFQAIILMACGMTINTIPDAYDKEVEVRRELQQMRSSKKEWYKDFSPLIIGAGIALAGITALVSEMITEEDIFSKKCLAVITGVSMMSTYSGFMISNFNITSEHRKLKTAKEREQKRKRTAEQETTNLNNTKAKTSAPTNIPSPTIILNPTTQTSSLRRRNPKTTITKPKPKSLSQMDSPD